MIAGASQAGAVHILVPDDGKFTAATDKGYQNPRADVVEIEHSPYDETDLQ